MLTGQALCAFPDRAAATGLRPPLRSHLSHAVPATDRRNGKNRATAPFFDAGVPIMLVLTAIVFAIIGLALGGG
ncbi:MAG: hypothetical protein AAAB14_08950, partial [Ensifer adhaerens]